MDRLKTTNVLRDAIAVVCRRRGAAAARVRRRTDASRGTRSAADAARAAPRAASVECVGSDTLVNLALAWAEA